MPPSSDNAPKYVVGLGNPGRKYQGTRHNVGYMVLHEIVTRWNFNGPKTKFHGQVWTGALGGASVTLLAPETYMNLSGLAVAELTAFYKAGPDDLLIVLDDLALPVGRLRARAGGSAGGHKGLADILRALGTDQVPRLRIGIGSPPPRFDAVDYVLGRFTAEETPPMTEAVRRAAEAVADWATQGITFVMDRYNQDAAGEAGPGRNGKGL